MDISIVWMWSWLTNSISGGSADEEPILTFPGRVNDEVPFVVIWNAPTERCSTSFGIDVDVKSFGLTENPKHGWIGPYITILYADFGRYPFVDNNGTIVNGGIPQAVNLTAHWEKVKEDIEQFIPDPGFTGLGVIDWEAWRPMWERNWDKKKIYQELSLERVRNEHPDWDKKRVERIAKKRFENGARVLMAGTLQLVRKLRPLGRWGYYHFADCYNDGGGKTVQTKSQAT
ncbi:Hyaluronidase-1 [Lamellibrachia satsuma]|nr:Hyaluronidase-1 [Lamellibrachia satsuma]